MPEPGPLRLRAKTTATTAAATAKRRSCMRVPSPFARNRTASARARHRSKRWGYRVPPTHRSVRKKNERRVRFRPALHVNAASSCPPPRCPWPRRWRPTVWAQASSAPAQPPSARFASASSARAASSAPSHVPGLRRMPGVEIVAVANRSLESSRRAADGARHPAAHTRTGRSCSPPTASTPC